MSNPFMVTKHKLEVKATACNNKVCSKLFQLRITGYQSGLSLEEKSQKVRAKLVTEFMFINT